MIPNTLQFGSPEDGFLLKISIFSQKIIIFVGAKGEARAEGADPCIRHWPETHDLPQGVHDHQGMP